MTGTHHVDCACDLWTPAAIGRRVSYAQSGRRLRHESVGVDAPNELFLRGGVGVWRCICPRRHHGRHSVARLRLPWLRSRSSLCSCILPQWSGSMFATVSRRPTGIARSTHSCRRTSPQFPLSNLFRRREAQFRTVRHDLTSPMQATALDLLLPCSTRDRLDQRAGVALIICLARAREEDTLARIPCGVHHTPNDLRRFRISREFTSPGAMAASRRASSTCCHAAWSLGRVGRVGLVVRVG